MKLEALQLRSDALSMSVLNLGGIVQSLAFHGPGRPALPVVLGYPDAKTYLDNPWYLGAVVGPLTNRLSRYGFEVGGETYRVPAHPATGCLHSGRLGFSRRFFAMRQVSDAEAELTLEMAHREDGFPGNRRLAVNYRLEGAGLHIGFRLQSDRLTPVNMTHHAYFNLNGAGSGKIGGHRLQLRAPRFLETRQGLPTGRILPVEADPPSDFRLEKPLGSHPHDTCFLADDPQAARIVGDQSGLFMTLRTSAPCVQLFTATGLQMKENGRTVDRSQTGFCLETQGHLDALSQPGFPSPLTCDARMDSVFSFAQG